MESEGERYGARAGGDWGGKRGGGALLPNEGSVLAELRMDVEDGVAKTEFKIFPSMVLMLLAREEQSWSEFKNESSYFRNIFQAHSE